MAEICEYLDSPFVRTAIAEINCGQVSASVPVPAGVKTLVVTNTCTGDVWVSFSGEGGDDKAARFVGHKLASAGRLIVTNAKGLGAVSAVANGEKIGGKLIVEFGEGDAESRFYRAARAPNRIPTPAAPAAIQGSVT